MEYYPLKRLWELASTLSVSQNDSRKRTYTLANWWIVVSTDHAHNILNVAYTPDYKWKWMSLKRAQTKHVKVCRYVWH